MSFIIRLPFCDNIHSLKSCPQTALQEFCNTEHRGISPDYQQFITEFIRLDHMKHTESPSNGRYFIPHFLVHTSGKFRVVFNTSSKEASCISLNDALMVSPRLQPDIFNILLRFLKFVFSIDSVRMYREIAVS